MNAFAKQNPLLIAALLVAGVAAYYLVKKIGGAGAAAVDAVSSGIAGAIIGATLPGDVEVTGQVLLPTGARLAMNSLTIDSKTLQFTYLGQRYRIARREGANYIAVTT